MSVEQARIARITAGTQLIETHLLARYPSTFHRSVAVRTFIRDVCVQHIERDLGDANFAAELCAGVDTRYWQRLSEALFSNELLAAGLPVRSARHGPDFLLEVDGHRIWIEVICPQPTGIPQDWLAPPAGQAVGFPHEAVLLRWTAAIKEKAEKLLGNPATGAKGYVEKGIVAPEDSYVIAINGRPLRGPHFASITGISQLPSAVEAAFAIGPMTLTIELNTNQAVGSGHQHRPIIRKPNGAAVPAYSFLDPAFAPVSAIWATDLDATWIIGNAKPMAVVHNPGAARPVPLALLPAQEEYTATPNGPDEYALERRPGRLAQP
jgi:type I restriction enzyme S subunit